MFDSVDFQVVDSLNHDRWTGSISDFFDYGSFQHIVITARGSRLTVLCGKCFFYRWIFLPELEVGCPQATSDDFFWNVERLSPLIGRVDSLSVVFGVHFALGVSHG